MPVAKTIDNKSMKMPEIKRKAQALGITPGKMKKPELIRSIQIAEGYMPCFGTSNGECAQTNCCFMEDCFKQKT